jgi:hypothetical protein
MIVLSANNRPLMASLRQRSRDAKHLLELCGSYKDNPQLYFHNQREGLMVQLLEATMIRYLEAMETQGILGDGLSQWQALSRNPLPKLNPNRPIDLEQLYVGCANLRDETWACQRMAQEISRNLAYFLERQAVSLEPLVRVMEQAGRAKAREAHYASG